MLPTTAIYGLNGATCKDPFCYAVQMCFYIRAECGAFVWVWGFYTGVTAGLRAVWCQVGHRQTGIYISNVESVFFWPLGAVNGQSEREQANSNKAARSVRMRNTAQAEPVGQQVRFSPGEGLLMSLTRWGEGLPHHRLARSLLSQVCEVSR